MGVRHCIAGGVFVLAVAVHLPAQEAPAAMSVAVEEGRLTCDIRMVPLSQVLQALAERTGVTFVPADTIRGDDVTLEMTNVPLETGLRRLLRRYDRFVYYGASEDSPSLRTVWIYPKGFGAALQPVAQDSLAAADIRQRVADPIPGFVRKPTRHCSQKTMRRAVSSSSTRCAARQSPTRVSVSGFSQRPSIKR